MIPNDLLERFFDRLPYPCYCIDWGELTERQAVALANVVELWPEEGREIVHGVLRDVYALACDTGFRAIRDAAIGLGRSEVLDLVPLSNYAAAMWVWLEEPEVFERASMFHQVQNLTGWRSRDDLPVADPRTDATALDDLGREVSRLLVSAQGRGGRCTVEHFRRDDGTDYFCCYADDHVRTVVCHDEDGELSTRSVGHTFEIAFALRPDKGVLELAAPVPTVLKADLEEAFAWTILDESIGSRRPRAVFELDRLKDRRFRLDTDPGDSVHAHLQMLQLDRIDCGERIIFVSLDGERTAVEMLEEYLAREVPRDRLQVTKTMIRFLFGNTTERRGGSSMIAISAPNTCNLRNERPERAAIVRKHIERWRLARVRTA